MNKTLKQFTTVLIGRGAKTERPLLGGSDETGTWREEVDGISFDGHRHLWGFSYEPHTYLKESELSGEEWRKGGWIKFFRDGVQVFEEFCREPVHAVLRIPHLLTQLEHLDWDKIKPGTKIYWKDTPCTIEYLILEQGAMVIKTEAGFLFPNPIWAEEEWQKHENRESIKVDFLDPHLWWFRK